jgi:MFS family permease
MRSGPQPHGATPGEAPTPRWGAFAYPMYRRYWVASLVRVFGMQFHLFAIAWLIVDVLDRSAFWLGAVGISQALPTILLSVPAGLLADRMEHRRLLLISQFFLMINYLLLATLILTDVVNIWMVLVWASVTGALSALGNPAQQAILPRLIDMRSIASAVSLINAIWSGIRIIAPGAAAVMIYLVGPGEAFLLTGIAFAVSIVLILMLRPAPLAPRGEGHDNSLMAGLRYVASNRIFTAVVGLSFFASMFGMSYQYLLAVFAHNILDVGALGFGIMGATSGMGALLGTIAAIRFANGPHRGQVMLATAALSGVFVAVFAQSQLFPLSLVMLFCSGFVTSIYLNIGMTTLQMLVPNHLRGRVMGVWSITWFLTPIGAFVVGSGAAVVGAQAMVAAGGLAVTLFAVILYVISPEVRIMPERPAEDAGGRPAEAPAAS